MKILVGEQIIEYKDEGKGKIILLLHGWGANLATFDQLAEHLVKKFRVVRFDFPGFGGSPKPPDNWDVNRYAQLTGDFIKKLKLDDLYALIGHSFGCRVIIKGNAIGSLTPKKIVLIGAAGIKSKQSLKNQTFKLIAKTGKLLALTPGLNKIKHKLRAKLYHTVGSSDYLKAGDMQKIFLNVIKEDLLSEVHKIAQPTLLIWGKDDDQVPVSDGHAIKQQISKARLVITPAAGHFVYVDNLQAVTKELDNFL